MLNDYTHSRYSMNHLFLAGLSLVCGCETSQVNLLFAASSSIFRNNHNLQEIIDLLDLLLKMTRISHGGVSFPDVLFSRRTRLPVPHAVDCARLDGRRRTASGGHGGVRAALHSQQHVSSAPSTPTQQPLTTSSVQPSSITPSLTLHPKRGRYGHMDVDFWAFWQINRAALCQPSSFSR